MGAVLRRLERIVRRGVRTGTRGWRGRSGGCFFSSFRLGSLLAGGLLLQRLHEPGAENAGRDRDHADAEDGDDRAEEAAERGDGVDVAVADRGERGDGPPEPGEGVAELLRLGVVFGVVDEEYGRPINRLA